MAYGKIKVDTLVYDNSGSDVELTVSAITAGGSLSNYALLAGATFTGDVNFDGEIVAKGDATNGSGQITLNCENNSHGVKIKGPPHSAAASYTLTLPNNTGTNSQFLTTNGSGVLSWSSPAGGVSLSVANTWTAGQRAEITTLTDGATVTPDLNDSNNYVLGPRWKSTIANPTNITADNQVQSLLHKTGQEVVQQAGVPIGIGQPERHPHFQLELVR